MPPESWLMDLREDLQARPGRVERSLQIVFATVVVLVAMMTLRVPNVAFALYVIFIVSNENPALSLRTGIASLVSVSVVISMALVSCLSHFVTWIRRLGSVYVHRNGLAAFA